MMVYTWTSSNQSPGLMLGESLSLFRPPDGIPRTLPEAKSRCRRAASSRKFLKMRLGAAGVEGSRIQLYKVDACLKAECPGTGRLKFEWCWPLCGADGGS